MEIEVLTSIYVTDEEIENVVTVKDIYTLLERKGVTVIN
jgi:acyl carrier protein